MQPRAALQLAHLPDEITHIVCCRDDPWRVTFCGAEASGINPAAQHVCTMCIEEGNARRPGWLLAGVCPMDRQPCPPEAEVDERIARETSP